MYRWKDDAPSSRYLLATNSSTHGRLEGHELADIRRRDRSFSSSIILTLRTLSHPHTGVLWLLISSRYLSKTHCRRRLLSADFGWMRIEEASLTAESWGRCKCDARDRTKGKGVTMNQRKREKGGVKGMECWNIVHSPHLSVTCCRVY